MFEPPPTPFQHLPQAPHRATQRRPRQALQLLRRGVLRQRQGGELLARKGTHHLRRKGTPIFRDWKWGSEGKGWKRVKPWPFLLPLLHFLVIFDVFFCNCMVWCSVYVLVDVGGSFVLDGFCWLRQSGCFWVLLLATVLFCFFSCKGLLFSSCC